MRAILGIAIMTVAVSAQAVSAQECKSCFETLENGEVIEAVCREPTGQGYTGCWEIYEPNWNPPVYACGVFGERCGGTHHEQLLVHVLQHSESLIHSVRDESGEIIMLHAICQNDDAGSVFDSDSGIAVAPGFADTA
jgi:hypothetical protein